MSPAKEAKQTKRSYPHEGHRQRMKKALLADGAVKFSDTEILEMLLYYVLPRCDTRKHAEELIERFGSLSGVLEADKSEISSVSGLKNGAEVLFSLLNEVIDRCGGKSALSLFEPERTKKYLVNLYRESETETVYALYFGHDGLLVDEQLVFRGGISSARFSLRTITEGVIRAGGHSVILAHNHPSGQLVPSNDDILSTKRIAAHLSANDIDLVEHYIVGKDGCVGIMNVK